MRVQEFTFLTSSQPMLMMPVLNHTLRNTALDSAFQKTSDNWRMTKKVSRDSSEDNRNILKSEYGGGRTMLYIQ